MTIEVTTEQGIFDDVVVVDAPPIARKFIGRPLSLLIKWMTSQGGFKMEAL